MPDQVSPLRAAWTRVVTAAGVLAGAGIALLMLPTVADVTFRKIAGPSLPGMVEISEIFLVIVVYLAMPAAMARRVHIFSPIMTSRLPERLAETLRTIGAVLVAATLIVMVIGSSVIAWDSVVVQEVRFGLVQVPIWPAKVAVPVGLGLMLIETLFQIFGKTPPPPGEEELGHG